MRLGACQQSSVMPGQPCSIICNIIHYCQCSSTGFDLRAILKFADCCVYNQVTKYTGKCIKFIQVIADFKESNRLTISMIQLPLKVFKSIAFFWYEKVSAYEQFLRRSLGFKHIHFQFMVRKRSRLRFCDLTFSNRFCVHRAIHLNSQDF